jgi:hypothetical protein
MIYKPNKRAVPDSGITGELWATNPTAIRKVKTITVTGNRGKAGKRFKYGNSRAELYDDWIYEDSTRRR